MNWIVFHPSVAPHVQQAALAFYEAGFLENLHTAVVDNPASAGQKLLMRASRLLGFDGEKEFKRRSISVLPPEKIISHPWGELLRVAVSRFDRDQRLSDLVWEQTERSFDRSVARSLHSGMGGVYGFEYSSRLTFLRARKLGLKVAYEMPAPEPVFVHELLQEERQRFPDLETPYSRHVARREQMWIDHRKVEWDCANVVIAASHFTRDSYVRAGWDSGKVKVIPLGAPEPLPLERALQGGSKGKGPLRLVWAGTFSVRKGAHYVLEAWRKNSLGHLARLDVYGTIALPQSLLSDLPPGVHLHGSIPRAELWRKFEESDALLFPTLCDGFGMVVTEAWACGLPVLTTNRAGASDKVVHQKNGCLFPAADAGAIAGCIHWCEANREGLQAMRSGAWQTAAAWGWTDYRAALRETLAPFLGSGTSDEQT